MIPRPEYPKPQFERKNWMNLNGGDQIYITAKRTGSNPYISDEKGNKIADLVQEK